MSRARGLRDEADLIAALGVKFSDEQLAAIMAPLKPAVIIAGAGSGKTTVMAARVVWLVGSGQVRPGDVLGLTFTRKAAAELALRVRTALVNAQVLDPGGVDDEGEQVILTYDSFAARLVSEHGLWLGYEADPTMITGAARYRLAAKVVATAAGPFDYLSRLRPASITERVLSLDGALQSHVTSLADLHEQTHAYLGELANAPRRRDGEPYASITRAEAVAHERLELASLARGYQELKRDLGNVEFADQMAAAARLATEVPGVGEQLRAQFRVVLLDEYQDTSAAQAALLAGLFSGPSPEAGRGHPVTAVGDPFQAIYGWRGAAASNILQFPVDFPTASGAPAEVMPLTVNRRSGPEILEVANRLAEPLRNDDTLSYGMADRLLQAAEGAATSQVETAALVTWPDEVDWVADRIAAAHANGQIVHWSDAAVLGRRNADVGAIYQALISRDVPAEIVGLGGLLTLPEVADVVSTLRLVDDVTANPDLIRLLTGPRWAIGPGDLELLGRRAVELARARRATGGSEPDGLTQALDEAVAGVDPTEVVSLAEALADLAETPVSESARERCGAFAAELALLRQHAAEPVTDLARRVVTTIGLEAELLASEAGAGATSQLSAFLDAIATYTEVDSDVTLRGLLGYLDAEADHGSGLDQALPSSADSVKLLTIHRAKGLEWDLVVLPALCDKTFPSDRVTENWVTAAHVLPSELRGDAGSVPQLAAADNAAFNDYVDELRADNRRSEDRLAYVAVTRARRIVIGSTHTWRPGDKRPRMRSDYFATMNELASVRVDSGPAPDTNPLDVAVRFVEWPAGRDPEMADRRRAAAAAVSAARADAAGTARAATELAAATDPEVRTRVEQWDAELAHLVAEAKDRQRRLIDVPVPTSLTATEVMVAQSDPARFAAGLARPMPRPPSLRARLGSQFHEWVLRYFDAPVLIDRDDLPGSEEGGEELRTLTQAFEAGRFAQAPPAELEFPVSLLVAGRVIRGRIDAVYTAPDVVPPGYRALVVDWKTGSATPDQLQLAIYRLAWAELAGVSPTDVIAGFYHVTSDRLELFEDLPARADLEQLVDQMGALVEPTSA